MRQQRAMLKDEKMVGRPQALAPQMRPAAPDSGAAPSNVMQNSSPPRMLPSTDVQVLKKVFKGATARHPRCRWCSRRSSRSACSSSGCRLSVARRAQRTAKGRPAVRWTRCGPPTENWPSFPSGPTRGLAMVRRARQKWPLHSNYLPNQHQTNCLPKDPPKDSQTSVPSPRLRWPWQRDQLRRRHTGQSPSTSPPSSLHQDPSMRAPHTPHPHPPLDPTHRTPPLCPQTPASQGMHLACQNPSLSFQRVHWHQRHLCRFHHGRKDQHQASMAHMPDCLWNPWPMLGAPRQHGWGPWLLPPLLLQLP
mmetsp:Transcript_7443/g.27280  ORF Transcript_7443/g.27280 Transcript_7443/m.27280 type:complete len:306 (-) Transcript_7443:698-1615(-)